MTSPTILSSMVTLNWRLSIWTRSKHSLAACKINGFSLYNHLEPVVVNILEAELLVEAGLLRVGGEGAGLAAAGVRRGGGAHLQRHGDTPTGDT